jgi:hypothetical protein
VVSAAGVGERGGRGGRGGGGSRHGGDGRSQEPRFHEPRQPDPKSQEPAPAAGLAPATAWDPATYVVEPAEGKTRFADLPLPSELLHAIADLNFKYCTPIQSLIMPETLKGKDAYGRAQTGTGKTAAFLVTIINDLLTNPIDGPQFAGEPRALIVAPTRELVMQIASDAEGLTKYCNLNVMAVVGGMDFEKQRERIRREAIDILVATPGRLLDFVSRRDLFLDQVETLVTGRGRPHARHGLHPRRQAHRQPDAEAGLPANPAVQRHLQRRHHESGAALDFRAAHCRDRAGKRGHRHRRAEGLHVHDGRKIPCALQHAEDGRSHARDHFCEPPRRDAPLV